MSKRRCSAVAFAGAIMLLSNAATPFAADLHNYRLPIAPEWRKNYDRKDWGGWKDENRNCRNTRAEILIAQSREPVAMDPRGCRVLTGRWVDPYTGRLLTDARDVDVDHIVPVQEAHDSGGFLWNPQQKAAFYNDPDNLVAVDKAANRQKGAQGPEEWIPDNPAVRCDYVKIWVRIKQKYELSADRLEWSAISAVLEKCP